MLKLVESESSDWNRFVLENGSGFLQSWEWGEFQEAVGRRVFRYRIDLPGDNGQSVARFTAIYDSFPFGRRYSYIPMGPIVSIDGDRRNKFGVAVSAIRESITREGLVLARLEPPAGFNREDLSRDDLLQLGLVPARARSPQHTSVVDLIKSSDELLADMKQKTRYNIRLAEKREVNVRQADPSDLRAFTKDIDRFQQLLAETAGRDRFHTHESDYYRRMLQVLAPKDGHDLSVRLMLADFEGQTLAAAVLAQFGDTMTYLHGASSSQYREVMAPYLLHWQAMLWAKEVGLSRYDFWGVAPEDSAADHSWSGLTRFKLGFGGQRESNLGTWELPGSKFWYGAYKITKRFF
ncbi:TPA: hypothetical protein DEP86_00425 [Candidatus Uhrbacteria bacterium]|nr:hypothetical protein [Candidatus Uhrbacteria bacterium]